MLLVLFLIPTAARGFLRFRIVATAGRLLLLGVLLRPRAAWLLIAASGARAFRLGFGVLAGGSLAFGVGILLVAVLIIAVLTFGLSLIVRASGAGLLLIFRTCIRLIVSLPAGGAFLLRL